jgi:hypothetical protein
MSSRSIPPDRRLERVVRLIAHDYKNYCQRSEVAFQHSNNRALPSKAADEIRNALDHLMRAFRIVFASESQRSGSSLASRSAKRPGANLALEAARCRRHLVGAQYWCLRFSIQERIKHIRKLLDSPMKGKNRHQQRYKKIEQCRKQFTTINATWKPVREPSESRNLTVQQATREIKKMSDTNARLDLSLERLEKLHSRIQRQYKGLVV